MSAEYLKDIGIIWTRLFDHRPFLNGEINFALKEFEEKRSDKEVEQLFTLLEHAADINDSQIKRFKIAVDTEVPRLKNQIESILNVTDAILDRAEEFKQDKTLEVNNRARKKEWEEFVEDMTYKCRQVDNTFEEKEEELQEFYADLEKKLIRH